MTILGFVLGTLVGICASVIVGAFLIRDARDEGFEAGYDAAMKVKDFTLRDVWRIR